jgi:hypothetical protein
MFHPDLQHRGPFYLSTRSAWFNFFYPEAERIYWYGNLLRGENIKGMYATKDQALAWPDKYVEPSVIGPR